MGQAFDDKGDVLGEAFGATKREVFDDLMRRYPDAAEIRIKSRKPPDPDPEVTDDPASPEAPSDE